MADTIIACLSQKGGVGKSTMSRLIATAYAAHEVPVCIYDFNPHQKTAEAWSALRENNGISPSIPAVEGTQANRMRGDKRYDVVIADGRPDSPEITLSIARAADLIVIPSSVTFDDLMPQRQFGRDLVRQGVPKERIVYVINRTTESKSLINDAYVFLSEFRVAKTSLPHRDSFIRCHSGGYSVGEVKEAVLGNMDGLKKATADLANEIATLVAEMEPVK